MSRKCTTGVLTLLLLMAALGLDCSVAQACPMCKEALAATEQGANLVRGFFWSILFMMAMPFTILGAFCGSMYLAVRRARTATAALLAGEGAEAGSNRQAGQSVADEDCVAAV